jgi:hypothetical protein
MEDVKKLSGDARIDALVIELRDKHGIHLSPEVAGPEPLPVEPEEEAPVEDPAPVEAPHETPQE